MKNSKINTYVFFDTESTGLSGARITELSLVAVHHQELSTYTKILKKKVEEKSNKTVSVTYPRVMNKLTLAVNPAKPVSPFIEEFTGLSNYNLEHQSRFRDGVGLAMAGFIASLAGPVCLVAHNGDRFDFPLLVKELGLASKAGSVINMPDDLRCCDTLKFFRWHFSSDNKVDNINAAKQQICVTEEEQVCDLVNDKLEEPGVCTPKKPHFNSSSFINTPERTPGQSNGSDKIADSTSKTDNTISNGITETPNNSKYKTPSKDITDLNSTVYHTPRACPFQINGITPLKAPAEVQNQNGGALEKASNDNLDCFDDSFDDCIDSQFLLEAFGDTLQPSGDAINKSESCENGKNDNHANFTVDEENDDSDENETYNTPPSTPVRIETNAILVSSVSKAVLFANCNSTPPKKAKNIKNEEFNSCDDSPVPEFKLNKGPRRGGRRGSKAQSGSDSEDSSTGKLEKPKSFSLPKLYEHLFGFPPVGSHGAEIDCLTLLQAVAFVSSPPTADSFEKWAMDNQKLLKDVKPMA